MRKWQLIRRGVLLAAIFFSAILSQNANAALKNDSSLYRLSLLQGVRTCYELYAKDSIQFSDFSNYASIFKDGWENDGIVTVTTKVGNTLGDGDLSCEEIFQGYSGTGGKATGLAELYPMPNTLQGFGYEASGAGNGVASNNSSNEIDRITITAKIDDLSRQTSGQVFTEGSLVCDGKREVNNLRNTIYWDFTKCSGGIVVKKSDGEAIYSIKSIDDNGTSFVVDNPYGAEIADGNTYTTSSMDLGGQDATDLKSAFENSNFRSYLYASLVGVSGAGIGNIREPGVEIEATPYDNNGDSTKDLAATYVPFNNSKTVASSIALYNLGVDESLSPIIRDYDEQTKGALYVWRTDYIYSLYYRYLQNITDEYPGITIANCGNEKPDQIYYLKNSSQQWCGINIPADAQAAKDKNVAIVVGSKLEKGKFSDVLEWFKDDASYENMSNDAYAGATVADDGTLDLGSALADNCYNQDVVGMSWILCPAIENAANATDGLDGILYSFLAVDPDMYGESSNVQIAWGYCRDLANVLMAIILLVIIASQVTGYGIDNYGIKKMLPRLLVMAVLINLSYIICQIAIDVSNILGASLNLLFQNISSSLQQGHSAGEGMGIVLAGTYVSLTAGSFILSMVTVILSLPFGPMGVIMLLLILFSALIAVLSFFLTLGARMVVIFIFTVISPLAFACYILPNTQSLFKKWWEVFKTCLIIYPICGALYGISFVIRGIVFSGEDIPFWLAMIAILAPFLPFLLLPNLVKGALSTLGKISGAIAAVSAGTKSILSRGEQRLQMSAIYKSAQEDALRRRTMNRAGYMLNKTTGDLQKKKVGRFGKFIRGGDIGMNKATAQMLRDYDTYYREINNDPRRVEAKKTSIERAIESENVTNAYEVLRKETNNGADKSKLNELFRQAVVNRDKAAVIAAARLAGRRADTAKDFINNSLMDDNISIDPVLKQALAKEIAEGETSKEYIKANAEGFEYAQNVLAGETRKYSEWDSDGENFLKAMSHHFTDNAKAVDQQNSSLKSIAGRLERGDLKEDDINSIRGVAIKTIEDHKKGVGPWDRTKAENIYKIAYGSNGYKAAADANGIHFNDKGEEVPNKPDEEEVPNEDQPISG